MFGVSGAWIARVHRTELLSESAQPGRYRNLLRSMLASGVTIEVALAARAGHAVASSSDFVGPVLLPWLRGSAFGVWTFFAFVQLRSLFSMLPSALYALGEIKNRSEHQRILGPLPPKRREQG